MSEAQRLQRLIKKDLAEIEEREGGYKKEPAFILGEQGAWTLNPKARIGFGEFAVFQMYQDSLKKGEPIDPVEELARREEASVRLKEAMGIKAGGGDVEMAMLDKLDRLGMLKKSEGGEGALLSQLNSLGLLKKPGEGEGAASETVRQLEAQVKQLTDELHRQEIEGLKGSIGALSNQITDLRNQMATQGKLEGRFAIMDKALSTGDSQLTGLRTDLKAALDTITQAGGPGPRVKSAEERARITKGLKGAVALERRAHELENELLFGKPPESKVAAKPAPASTTYE